MEERGTTDDGGVAAELLACLTESRSEAGLIGPGFCSGEFDDSKRESELGGRGPVSFVPGFIQQQEKGNREWKWWLLPWASPMTPARGIQGGGGGAGYLLGSLALVVTASGATAGRVVAASSLVGSQEKGETRGRQGGCPRLRFHLTEKKRRKTEEGGGGEQGWPPERKLLTALLYLRGRDRREGEVPCEGGLSLVSGRK